MRRDELTPEWLTEVLRRSGALGSGCVTAFREEPWAGGIAVTSRVHRLVLDYDRPTHDAPPSLIVKLANPDYERGPRLYRREVAFYRDVAPDVAVGVPHCYHAACDDEGNQFALVLQDLSDASPGHRLEGCDARETGFVLRAMATLHAAGWGRPIEGWEKGYPPERIEYLTRAYTQGWPRLLDRGEYEVTSEIRVRGEALLDGLADDLARLDRSPRTLIHTDLHVENFCLDGDRPYFLDWQNASYGPPALDLVQAVGGNTRPDVLRERGDGLLEEYGEALAAGGVTDYPLEAIRADHRAAIHWLFLGGVRFLSKFKPETEHDRRTVTLEWERSAAALLAMG